MCVIWCLCCSLYSSMMVIVIGGGDYSESDFILGLACGFLQLYDCDSHSPGIVTWSSLKLYL